MKPKFYAIAPIEPLVFLRKRTGEVYTYSSYREFLYFLNYNICRRIGTTFDKYKYEFQSKTIVYSIDYIAKQNGIVLDPEVIYNDLREFNYSTGRQKRGFWWHQNNKIYVYRYSPVPGIGVRHYGSWYRRMKTTQERRWSLAEKVDGVPWRKRRNFSNLPNSWDDKQKNVLKTWKKHRKTQWKSGGYIC